MVAGKPHGAGPRSATFDSQPAKDAQQCPAVSWRLAQITRPSYAGRPGPAAESKWAMALYSGEPPAGVARRSRGRERGRSRPRTLCRENREDRGRDTHRTQRGPQPHPPDRASAQRRLPEKAPQLHSQREARPGGPRIPSQGNQAFSSAARVPLLLRPPTERPVAQRRHLPAGGGTGERGSFVSVGECGPPALIMPQIDRIGCAREGERAGSPGSPETPGYFCALPAEWQAVTGTAPVLIPP
ncbi:hypothetical protein AAFF_G00190640 [Aldrovandia affinis]|uniref:Uncharacterized protein n=1 Tax=Aldrovandia affinis TaxID=143900 RepID=A0AAD7R075_9TELE|nr:hypothetical protein AAFF_G00190640 [Aldrovandia affinis]